MSRDVMRYKRYTVQDGLSHRMISGFMQDSIGNIWLSTWNGLCKFDGESFVTYNETASQEKVGRLSLVRATRQGAVWTIRQSDNQEFLLKPNNTLLEPIETGTVKCLPIKIPKEHNAPDSTGLLLIHDSIPYHIPYEGAGMTTNMHYLSFLDQQGNIWANFDDALYQITFDKAIYEQIDQIDPLNSDRRYGDEIRAMLQLRDGGFLLACKNKCIYKYGAGWKFEGYLTKEGEISTSQIDFGTKIYCMKQAADGSIWMGSRGKGLYYVCSPQLDKQIKEKGLKPVVKNYQEDKVSNNHIYDLEFVDENHLILATWNGGIQSLQIDSEGNIKTDRINEAIRKTRRIEIIRPNLIAFCSTQGIIFVDNKLQVLKQLGTMDFSDLLEYETGHFYAASLNGGIYTFNLNTGSSAENLDSLRLQKVVCKETDNIVESISKTKDGMLWLVSDNMVTKYDPIRKSAQIIDRNVIGNEVIFGEAKPMVLDDHLIIGTLSGRMQIDLESPKSYQAKLILNTSDTLRIEWGEKVDGIKAIAMDLRQPRQIQYAWRELPDSTWIPLGRSGILELPNLWPGIHTIEIRSTDAKEIWADNNKTITIVVTLSIGQKVLLFGGLIILLLLFVMVFRSMFKRKPKMEEPKPAAIQTNIQPSEPVVVTRDQQFIEQVTKIVEEHIDDPMLDVEKMTTYMNTSRTILYAKFKELLDTTPALFITEIRLKRAVQLLETRQYRVNEIAAMCGFTDPKYFTRHFKQRIGITPAKYLETKTGKEGQKAEN